jgi:hypothetical protein
MTDDLLKLALPVDGFVHVVLDFDPLPAICHPSIPPSWT